MCEVNPGFLEYFITFSSWGLGFVGFGVEGPVLLWRLWEGDGGDGKGGNGEERQWMEVGGGSGGSGTKI